ncbi:MAG: phosphopantetheine-binding protein [Desulfovibrionaceae bacterium]|nr:phosphopantetheine-binding protein [Desulfovibrionaceae bacterium]
MIKPMDRNELIEDLKGHILDELPLEDVNPDDLQADTLLFDEDGLGLDSLDAVELVVLLEKHYDVAVADAEAARKIFSTLSSLADYVLEQQAGSGNA